MAKYVYPAVFTPEEGGGYSVFFPDLEGCYTCGDDLQEALFMAEDVLSFTLYGYEAAKQKTPEASEAEEVERTGKEFVNYVTCDTLEYAKMHHNRAVKKTLTIPEWLNEAAIRQNINFSQVLQEALLQRVNM